MSEGMVDLARSVCVAAHAGQVDKGGKPYFLHPFYIASQFVGIEKEVAYLHDVIEDSTVTLEDLRLLGFSERTLSALSAITRIKGETYREYLSRLKCDPMAVAIKLADLEHNADISRIPNPTIDDEKRVQKYRSAIEYLQQS